MAKVAVDVELFYSGVWHSITDTEDVYTRDPIQITRDAHPRAARSMCTASIENRDGKYSPRNPMSELYGLIGRNTPFRVIINGSIRFSGEIERFPQRWNVKGNDVWAPIAAYGILRRLGAPGVKVPERSALARAIVLAATPPLAWWPMDTPAAAGLDASDMFVADITGSSSPDLSWAVGKPAEHLEDGFSTSARDIYVHPLTAVTVASGVSVTSVTTARPTSDTSSFSLSHRIGPTFFVNVIPAWNTGVPTLIVTAAGVGTIATASAAVATRVWDQGAHHWKVTLTQNGANIDVSVSFDGAVVATGSVASTLLSASAKLLPGLISALRADVTWSHVAVWASGAAPDLSDPVSGYAGELAGVRIERLCDEEGIEVETRGADPEDTEPLGAQRVVAFVELLWDAAEGDGGLLYEPREFLGLAYRPHVSLYNQEPAVELDYAAGSQVAPPLEPVEDTEGVVNDVTVTRHFGGSARAVKETGTLNIQERTDDPDGVGRIPKDFPLSLAEDAQTVQQAAWKRHLGTWDELRYPVVQMDLTAMKVGALDVLIEDTEELDIGDLLVITNPPSTPLSPEDIEQHALGFVETIESHHRVIVVNGTPARPYTVGILDDTTFGRLDTAGSTTIEALDTTETGVDVTSPGAPWSTTDEPYDVMIGGERMTVTTCTGAGPAQTLTVTRSINGVVKTHASGAAVSLADPLRLAR